MAVKIFHRAYLFLVFILIVSSVFPVSFFSVEGVSFDELNSISPQLYPVWDVKKENSNYYSQITSSTGYPMYVLDSSTVLKEWIFYPKTISFSFAVYFLSKQGFKILNKYPVLEAFRLFISKEDAWFLKRFGDIYDITNLTLKLSEIKNDQNNTLVFGSGDYVPLQVSDVWDLGINGSGVVIGLLDTTVLYSGLLEGKRFVTKVFGEGDPSNSWTYHATSVATIMVGYNSTAQQPFGVAYGAKIANAQLGVDSYGNLVGDYFAAMDWLGSIPEVSVINFSFGAFPIGDNDALVQAAEALVRKGKLVVASAGNEGSSKWYKVNSPGTSNELLSVGASVKDNSIAYFSSGGPTYYFGPKPDIVAPGYGVEVSNGVYKSGTSFSTPIVSGIAALLSQYLRENAPEKYSNALIKASIIGSATPIVGDIRVEGAGLVNAKIALQLLNNSLKNNGIVVVQPYSIPYSLFYNVAPYSIIEQRIFVTSNKLNEITYYLEGNISQFISISLVESGLLTNIYSFKFEAPGSTGKYTGSIVFSCGGVNDTINVNFLVGENWQGIALVDLKHTVNDDLSYDLFEGENLGEFFSLLMDLNIYPELFREGNLNELNLSKYSFVILPDVITIYSPDVMEYLPDQSLNAEELSSLISYVNNGGRLFIFFQSLFENVGTDYEAILPLMMNLGLSVAPTLITQKSPFVATTLNCSWFSRNTNPISHLGTYFLHAGLESIPYVSYNDQVYGYLRTTSNYGFVVTLSSNFEVDNKGLTGQYSGINNKAIITELLNALQNPAPLYIKKIKLESEHFAYFEVQSSTEVIVEVDGKPHYLASTSNNLYVGKIDLGTTPSTITIKNDIGFIKYALTNANLELPEVNYYEDVLYNEWIKIAVLKYSQGSLPPQAVQLFVDDKNLPVYIEQAPAEANTFNVWINTNISEYVTPGKHNAQLTIFNTEWNSKTYSYQLSVQDKNTASSSYSPPTSNNSFLYYSSSISTILVIAITYIYFKKKT